MKEERRKINACIRRFCQLNGPDRGISECQGVSDTTVPSAFDWANFLDCLKVAGRGRLHGDGR